MAVDAIEYLRASAVVLKDPDIWFEATEARIPLRANLPIGVLFDICSTIMAMRRGSSTKLDLPWALTVHFSSFPADALIRCGSLADSERFFLHSLKQALFLLGGSTRGFNAVSVEDQKQLWDSVCQGSRHSFNDVAEGFKPKSMGDCRMLPIRIFVFQKGHLTFPRTVQRPVNCEHSSQDLLSVLQKQFLLGGGAQGEGREEVVEKAIVAGIEVPLSASIFDLWHLFAHPDLFLYICVHTQTLR